MSKLTPITFSQQVERQAQADSSTLLEAMVRVCDDHQVPYDDVCRFVDVDGSSVNLITPQLKEKLEVECRERGLLVGRRPNTNNLNEFL